MSANKAKNTKPEILLRKELSNRGIKGYRLHLKTIPGRPDIAFTKKKLVIFINGCFWHRCPYCKLRLPKSNRVFWRKKFNVNKERDLRKTKELKRIRWKVLTIWECQLKKNTDKQLYRIIKVLNEN